MRLDNSSKLYIFTTSELPDPYVNVLAHSLRNFALVEVCFVRIKEPDVNEDDVRISRIQQKIYARLEELAKERLDDDGVPLIDAAGRVVYNECLEKLDNIRVVSNVIPLLDLDRQLTEFTAAGRPLFDVTALSKQRLMDVVALLLSRGCSDVYTFYLKKSPSHNESDLIHALTVNEYTYASIAESRHIETARRRMVARTLTFRSIVWITLAIAIAVAVVQALFPEGWPQSVVTVAATATSIAAWLYFFRRDTTGS